MNEKYEKLQAFFKENPNTAIAFSGGADSAFLLHTAVKCSAAPKVYYVRSAFQPEFELEDARRLCAELDIELNVIELNVLDDENIAANPKNRCYYCKQRIFSAIKLRAEADGCRMIIDGTNASDDAGDRPGMKALRELEVRSPLRECGITKAELRELSRQQGVFTWDKPAYACLATRIPTGERITQEKLTAIELSENELFKLGYSDFRVRTADGTAKLQFKASERARAEAEFETIKNRIGAYFNAVCLDTAVR